MDKPLTVHQMAVSIGKTHHALQEAYCEIAQSLNDWPKELDEYLYDETYCGTTAKKFVEALVEFLEITNKDFFQLAIDSRDLSSDLLRVGRGDGFRV